MKSFIQHLTESQQINLSKKAYATLSSDAKHAIDKWEASNWIDGELERHFKANDHVAQEIERVFAPIRATLPDRVKLYRGIRTSSAVTGWQNKVLQSWTDDPRVAEHFAGRRQPSGKWKPVYYEKVPTESDIQKAVEQFKRSGYTKFLGIHYILSKQNPIYYNMFDRDREFLTDGDVDRLYQNLKHEVDQRIEYNQTIMDRGQVLERLIPKQDIVWITNNLKSKEYITKVQK